jgi:hypothetical protein
MAFSRLRDSFKHHGYGGSRRSKFSQGDLLYPGPE